MAPWKRSGLLDGIPVILGKIARGNMTELHFLDFLSLFAYNKLELLWITIAI